MFPICSSPFLGDALSPSSFHGASNILHQNKWVSKAVVDHPVNITCILQYNKRSSPPPNCSNPIPLFLFADRRRPPGFHFLPPPPSEKRLPKIQDFISFSLRRSLARPSLHAGGQPLHLRTQSNGVSGFFGVLVKRRVGRVNFELGRNGKGSGVGGHSFSVAAESFFRVKSGSYDFLFNVTETPWVSGDLRNRAALCLDIARTVR